MLTKYSKLLLLFLLSLIALASPLAQTGGKTGAAAVTPQLGELREKGSEALFNLDYDTARQWFKEMTQAYPDDPTGPEMLATTLWLDRLNQARRLQAAIYSTQSSRTFAISRASQRNWQRLSCSATLAIRRRCMCWEQPNL
jgi:hypothetical protein